MAEIASGLNSGSGFTSSDTITSTTLNDHVNDATISNIVNADIASNALIAVTKLADITNNNLVGRVDNANNADVPIVIGGSGDAGVLFDNDDLLDNSDTAGGSATRGATQQSIKAYVDAITQKEALFYYNDSSVTVLNTDNSTFSQCPLTEFYNFISGASVSSNNITLPAGTYIIDGSANIAITNNNENNGAINILEKTDGTDLLRGMDVSTDNDFSTNSTRITKIIGTVQFTESTTIRWMFRRQGVGSRNVTLGRNLGQVSAPNAYLKITKLGL